MRKTAALLLIPLLSLFCLSCRRTVISAASRQETDADTATDEADADFSAPEAGKQHTCAGFSAEEDGALTAIAEAYGPTAVQLAVLEHDAIRTYCYGEAELSTGRAVTADTKYRVASLSKLVAAVTFMAAKDRGYVDEQEDISFYFKEPCRNPAFPNTSITPAMLMTHTASLDTEGPTAYYDGMLSDGVYLQTEPGEAYNYSNLGYGVLSCVLERATGVSFNTLAKAYVFEPLGIDASYIYNELENKENVGALYGEYGGLSIEELSERTGNGLGTDLSLACGNLIISAKDYVKILGVLLHGGADVDGARVLLPESTEAMLEERFRTDAYGVAFGSLIRTNVVKGKTLYVHTGSAYGMFSAFAFDPVEKKAAAVFTVGEPRWEDPETEIYMLCLELIRAVWQAA